MVTKTRSNKRQRGGSDDLAPIYRQTRRNPKSVIGSGGYGVVRKVATTIGKGALKYVAFNDYANYRNNVHYLSGPNSFNREVEGLLKVEDSPYTIHILDAQKRRRNGFILTELLDTGMELHKATAGSINDTNVKSIVIELLKGLDDIHSHGVLHLDIKPENLWVYPDTGKIKYIDFGLWCKLDCETDGLRGTPGFYRTTRFVGGKAYWNKTSDFYSLAVTIKEIRDKHKRFLSIDNQRWITIVFSNLRRLTNDQRAVDTLPTRLVHFKGSRHLVTPLAPIETAVVPKAV
jgi:serine/threonine protein kinase